MDQFDYNIFFDNSDIVELLNKNKDNIERFEVIDSFYLNIHFNDGTYIQVEPEYGAIYFNEKSK